MTARSKDPFLLEQRKRILESLTILSREHQEISCEMLKAFTAIKWGANYSLDSLGRNLYCLKSYGMVEMFRRGDKNFWKRTEQNTENFPEKSHYFYVRLPDSIYKKVTHYCVMSHSWRSTFIVSAIVFYLQHLEQMKLSTSDKSAPIKSHKWNKRMEKEVETFIKSTDLEKL